MRADGQLAGEVAVTEDFDSQAHSRAIRQTGISQRRRVHARAIIETVERFQIYRQIIMPNAGPVIATVAIFTFLGSWNSFLWPNMVIQSEDVRPVMVGMNYFFQQNTQWGVVMAYATMVTLPVLAIFLAFQKAFVTSLAGSSVKG